MMMTMMFVKLTIFIYDLNNNDNNDDDVYDDDDNNNNVRKDNPKDASGSVPHAWLKCVSVYACIYAFI